MAPTRHWVTCSSNPGVGGIFFLTLAPFLLHLIQSVSRVKSLGLSPCRLGNPKAVAHVARAAHRGGQLGHFAPGSSLKGAPGGPTNTCLKDRYTLIEQSDLNTLIEQSQYSSEEQCSKLIDKEIWLVMGSYCHCQQVVTFFFFFFWSSPYNLGQGPHFNSLPWAP